MRAPRPCSAIIAGGLVPAAIEMMDARITARRRGVRACGLAARCRRGAHRGGRRAASPRRRRRRAGSVDGAARTARARCESRQSDVERALWWKARKSAFGAIARINPDYYLHDTVVPRRKLVEVLREVYAIAERYDLIVMNVFHAGDGNLHPLLVVRSARAGRDGAGAGRGQRDRAGIGRRRRGALGRARHRHREARLHADAVQPRRPRRAGASPRGVRPGRRREPAKGAAAGSRCGDLQSIPAGAWV